MLSKTKTKIFLDGSSTTKNETPTHKKDTKIYEELLVPHFKGKDSEFEWTIIKRHTKLQERYCPNESNKT